jgi:hypothetical protein
MLEMKKPGLVVSNTANIVLVQPWVSSRVDELVLKQRKWNGMLTWYNKRHMPGLNFHDTMSCVLVTFLVIAQFHLAICPLPPAASYNCWCL